MRYIYMDETWNQWPYWKQWNSRYFFIVFLLTKNSSISEQVLKKTFKWMMKKWIKHKWWVFHTSNELNESRMKILEYSQWKDFMIATYYVDKTNIGGLSKDPHLLYNNMVIKLLKRCIDKNIILQWEKVQFIAARKETNRFLNKQFTEQIKYSIEPQIKIDVLLRYPLQEKWLQHVDSMALPILHKYEFNNITLYNIMKDHIVIEEEIPRN